MTLAHSPSATPGAWDLDPVVLVLALAATVTYVLGVRELRLRRSARAPSGARQVAFHAGVLSATAAVVSPLHGWSEALFAAHMTQHLLLIVVSAPLLVAGRPAAPVLAALPITVARAASRVRSVQRRRAPVLLHPVTIFAAHALVVWAWHLPTLYRLALEQPLLHGLEHWTFIGTSVLLWSAVLGEHPIGDGRSVLLLFATGLQSAALGALLTFAGAVLYEPHAVAAPIAGFDPLTDQQLAGVIMWIPPGILYLAATAVMLARLLRDVQPAAVEDGGRS